MDSNLIWLSCSLAILSLITTIAMVLPFALFKSRPNLGISFWISSVVVAVLALLSAIAAGITSVLKTYWLLRPQDLSGSTALLIVAVSFTPWILFAVVGVALSLASLRIEPLRVSSRQVDQELLLAAPVLREFKGVEVRELPLASGLAFAKYTSGAPRIYVSAGLVRELNATEVEHILLHEWYHISRRHLPLLREVKRLSKALSILHIFPRAYFELSNLTELAAENYLVRRIGQEALKATTSKYREMS